MNDSIIAAARQSLHAAQRILIISHIRPDGDAVGSLLGLGLALQAVGKDVQMVLADGVPSAFRMMNGSNQVRKQAELPFDLVIVVDCSDLPRIGDVLNRIANNGHEPVIPDINIDHHVTNLNFAKINLVDPSAVATAEVLSVLFPSLGLPFTEPVVEALLTGIITDTLGFRTSNIHPATFRLVAELMERGGDLPKLYRHALLQRSYAATRLWGAGLSRLERKGPIIYTTLTLSDRRAVEYPGRDDADLINIIASIEDAEVALIFVEQSDQHVKVSWRAQSGLDVSQIALQFGGGGHKAAAGADIAGTLDDVKEKVLKATYALFEGTSIKR